MSCNNCGKGIKAIKNIAIGYTNFARAIVGVENAEVEALAQLRLSICVNQCTDRRQTGTKKIKGEPILWCNNCSCYISAKIRVKDIKCPNNKW